jgi:hypothetical protein
MKGLILASMDRKEEAMEYVKKGVRADMTSYICMPMRLHSLLTSS